jgi:hypothetical protein
VVVTVTTVSVGVESVAVAVSVESVAEAVLVEADVLSSPNILEKKFDNENGSLSVVPALVDARLPAVDWTGALVIVVFVSCRFTCLGK